MNLNIGALMAQAAVLKEQLKQQPCERCTLLYDREKHDSCPHFGDLDDEGLRELQAKYQAMRRDNHSIGRIFFVIALILGVLLLLSIVG